MHHASLFCSCLSSRAKQPRMNIQSAQRKFQVLTLIKSNTIKDEHSISPEKFPSLVHHQEQQHNQEE
jgi:hypothetical protein